MIEYNMYSLKASYREKLKRRVVATSFFLVILAEFGEFFVPKNDNHYNGPNIEMPDHVPEEGMKFQVQKKPTVQVSDVHNKQHAS